MFNKILPISLSKTKEEMKGAFTYEGTDNGVKLYKYEPSIPFKFIDISINRISAFFFKGLLITIYLQLQLGNQNVHEVAAQVEKALKMPYKCFKTPVGFVYLWEDETEVLGIVEDVERNFIYVYYSTSEMNVFSGET